MDLQTLGEKLAPLPLLSWQLTDPRELEFTQRVRHVCRTECPMYGTTWACPPAVGTVEACRDRCQSYVNCLMISTAAEVSSISDMQACLATRADHEAITDQVRDILRDLGAAPWVVSSQACHRCSRCAWLDGEPCRHPEQMHPCLESQGINLIPTLERYGVDFHFGNQVVTWFSLLFF